METLLHRLLLLSNKLYKALLHRLLFLPNTLYILTESIKHGHNTSVLLDGLEVLTPGCLIGDVNGRSHSREIGLLTIHYKMKKDANPVALLILVVVLLSRIVPVKRVGAGASKTKTKTNAAPRCW